MTGPTTRVRVCPVADLAEGACRAVATGSCEALVTVVGGQPYAVSDRCRHRGGRLSDGVLRDGIVMCPEHFWRYDVRTGSRTGGAEERLERYGARIVDGWVEVELPDEPADPASLRDLLLAHARAGDR